ncbi:MAG: hypothetical protein JKY37_19220 [Nannocystaceae bacterium]|nr:hypothetical protein [Nannocystaceae bacterium]
MFSGGHLALHIGGPGVTVPAPTEILDALQEATITLDDAGRSGFQLSLALSRPRGVGNRDYPTLGGLALKIGNRVQLTALLGGKVHPLMDGIVTNHQTAPSLESAGSTLTVSGEDVTVMLDQQEIPLQLPMPVFARVNLMLAPLASYGVVPVVIPPVPDIPPLVTDSPPTIDGTFFSAINKLAGEANYVFAWRPGLLRGQSFAYFGPKEIPGPPQPPLTFGMGGAGNLNSISFTDDGTKAKTVYGFVQEQYTNAPMIPVVSLPFPFGLEAVPATVGNLPLLGLQKLSNDEGGNVVQAYARATAQHWGTLLGAASASGELDTVRYGAVLQAQQTVEVRGSGWTHDGAWRVKNVTHKLSRGAWTQSFNLERSGTGSKLERVVL